MDSFGMGGETQVRSDAKEQFTFKPSTSNLIAGLIIALLMIGGSVGIGGLLFRGISDSGGKLPLWADKGWCWVAIAIFFMIAMVLLVGGFFVLYWMWSLVALRVVCNHGGFSVVTRAGTENFLWCHIVYVRETHLFQRPPVLTGPAILLLPKIQSKSYILRTDDNREFAFDGNTIRRHNDFAKLIKIELIDQNIPWEIVEVHA